MCRYILVLHLLFLFFSANSQTPLLIGVLEPGESKSESNQTIPYARFHFIKEKGRWQTLNDTMLFTKAAMKANYKGSVIANPMLTLDLSYREMPDTGAYHLFLYHTAPDKKLLIPEKTGKFPAMPGTLTYRPLVVSNCSGITRTTIIKRKPINEDRLLLHRFLHAEAIRLQLGKISKSKNIISKVNSVFVLSNTCYIIEADIELNMYCYKEKVPFDMDESYFLTGYQKYFISKTKHTPHALFLVNNKQVTYLDYQMIFLDNADYDGDGFDEILFRTDRYNYSGYLMITEKWTSGYSSGWSYH